MNATWHADPATLARYAAEDLDDVARVVARGAPAGLRCLPGERSPRW